MRALPLLVLLSAAGLGGCSTALTPFSSLGVDLDGPAYGYALYDEPTAYDPRPAAYACEAIVQVDVDESAQADHRGIRWTSVRLVVEDGVGEPATRVLDPAERHRLVGGATWPGSTAEIGPVEVRHSRAPYAWVLWLTYYDLETGSTKEAAFESECRLP